MHIAVVPLDVEVAIFGTVAHDPCRRALRLCLWFLGIAHLCSKHPRHLGWRWYHGRKVLIFTIVPKLETVCMAFPQTQAMECNSEAHNPQLDQGEEKVVSVKLLGSTWQPP